MEVRNSLVTLLHLFLLLHAAQTYKGSCPDSAATKTLASISGPLFRALLRVAERRRAAEAFQASQTLANANRFAFANSNR